MNSKKHISFVSPAILYILLLCLVFPVVYYKLFSSGFVSWDDAEVLLKNRDVHDFNIKAFFTNYYVGNYAPLTMMSFALDWLLFHGSAWHHVVNVFIHLINGILVFTLIKNLSGNFRLAVLVSIIFCFHPVQIETVAWVAAKNNLVYSLFFLLSLLMYIRFVNEKKAMYYMGALVLFALSALSKPSAVCLPLCLFVMDYVLGNPVSLKSTFNKIPFFIIAAVMAVVTIYARTEDKFMNEEHAFALHERIGYAGYALLQYIYKYILPIDLSVIYPYPQNKGFSIGVGYIIIIVFIAGCYLLYRRKQLLVLSGILFFVINLLLVLQFVPFGEVLTADRYMYLPVIGLSLAVFSVLKAKEKYLRIIAFVLLLILAPLSFYRTSVWKNSISLYSDILKKYPHSYEALSSLGAEYMLSKNYDQSLNYLNRAVSENKLHYKSYYNRGLLFAQTNRISEAIADFSKAIELAHYPKAYVARANAYYLFNDYQKAMADAEQALKTDTDNAKAYFVLGNCYDDQNQLNKGLQYYNRAIELNSTEAMFYLRRAILFGKLQNYSAALQDLDNCTTIFPDYAEAYYWKGVVKVNMKQNPCADLKKAAGLGFTQANAPLANYCR